MVRKKTSPSVKNSVFAAPAKVFMLERNKSMGTPQKTPVSTGKKKTAKRGSLLKDITLDKSQRKKRRARPGMQAIREIRKFQKTTSLLIPKLPFSRIVREILQEMARSADFRMTSMALMALQEAAEMAMVNMFEVANLCCLHAHRVTLDPRDIHLTRRAFGLGHPINY